MALDDPPHSIASNTLRLFGVDVKVHVLSDGQRVIEADSMAALLEAMGDSDLTINHTELEEFAKWQKGF